MSSFHPLPRHALALSACTLAATVQAQQTAPQTVLITGNPLRQQAVAPSASVLTGTELLLRRGSTLGETLAAQPGVAQSAFGPNASRPLIRGQEGDRIRILGNAGASLDASALSGDHAVPIDPLAIERIEVLRGPAALMYGGSALGGVVNVIDNRIPGARIGAGLQGTAELRFGGAAHERSQAAVLEGDAGPLAWHADGFSRRTDDLRVPAFTHPEDGGRHTRVLNSSARAEGGALGAAWVGTQGHAGFSLDTVRQEYGTVVEEAVRIRLQRDKLASAGEWRAGEDAALPVLRWQASRQDYVHRELEGGEVGTTFRNQGADVRLEATHRAVPLGGLRLQGAFGLQAEDAKFSALGEEAFVPTTRTRQLGVFLVESLALGEGRGLSLGLRQERVSVASQGDAPDAEEARFGAAQTRHFNPRSAALGGHWALGRGWQASASVARSERAPASYELFANGVHVATAVFERGDPGHRTEVGRQLDLGLQWQAPNRELKLNLFDGRFARYLVLLPTGEPDALSDEGEAFPVQAFQAVRARLRGAEVQALQRWAVGPGRLELKAQADTVRGDNLSAAEPLPRLAPWRASLQLAGQHGPYQLRVEVQHAARQGRVPQGDATTPAWTQWHLAGSWEWRAGPLFGQAYLRGTNLGNALARNAASASTVRALSPLPGRGVQLGVKVSL